MQALSVLPLPHAFLVADEFAPVPAKFNQDFNFKLKIDHNDEKFKEQGQEFSFACPNPQGSLVTADDIFDNGQIRPMLPIFDQSILFTDKHSAAALHLRPPLKKLFVERQCDIFPSDSEPQGQPEGLLICELSRETTALELEVEDSKEMCKKSNSMGFSKLWRFRQDLKLRSNGDGKGAFVFLNTPALANSRTKGKNVAVKKGKRRTASSSAHEKLYVMNRKRKESNRWRSFLPYRQQLVGFFNLHVNGFNRNLHPF